MRRIGYLFVLVSGLASLFYSGIEAQRIVSCYDARGNAQRCIPPFMNAAYDVEVEATNTCGLKQPQEYCMQTGVTGATKSCETCDAHDRDRPDRAHPAKYLTDFNNNEIRTWWQSETMLDGRVQYPHSVNLTLKLGKAFDITYVRLKFYSSRPESFMILKRSSHSSDEGEWIPFQYYSTSCEETYGVKVREIITRENEAKAICTDEFSDISPLSGASVVFSTLEGRPSAYEFENSPVLQDWVQASDIRITLTRMNTFRDEVFGDPSVLRSYFYAISDFSVGGRCRCNGHASECVKSTGQGLEEKLVCRCEHHTNGPDCSECLPFYNDRPWGRATAIDAHECKACNCNSLSSRCFFDEELYQRTGHGGHCLDCRENTAGPHCERCKEGYFRQSEEDRCEPCQCNIVGSVNSQCDENGRCLCKAGVTGNKCDRCATNFYDFGPNGCKECQCVVSGSKDNNPVCMSDTGICVCKDYVEGRNCDRCKPGYFNLDSDNPMGCMACFCHGHASVCTSASGYYKKVIQSDFSNGVQKWSGIDSNGRAVSLEYSGVAQALGISSSTDSPVYFIAPSSYLGNQRLSYSQFLTFSLRVGEEGARASAEDIILEGDGLKVSVPIYSQGNPVPRTLNQEYRFRLFDSAVAQWYPKLTAAQFQRLLGNLTAIKIRGSYTPQGIGFIDNVRLEGAASGSNGGEVRHVEQCSCPPEYVGQYCESCAPGYHRDPVNGGSLARCVPCKCNGHSETCDKNTGRCICEHNTVGDNCERCAPGYYGYALRGSPDDCKACPCPEGGECVELPDGEVACINCKEGHTGNRCEMCADGYWGDPEGRNGPRRPCTKCICTDNIDPNAVGNCNSRTGECLKCIYNTTGWNCEKCLVGYYGNALEHKCTPCECYVNGSTLGTAAPNQPIPCDQKTGQCQCHFRVAGRRCDQCEVGYWNIDSKRGCEPCTCDLTGSFNTSCQIKTGQCHCKPGVGSRRCDNCAKGFYGFSKNGCTACECNMTGSYHDQCDLYSGQCPCKPNVEGMQCQKCVENKYNMSAGCVDCPPCYNLVQTRVNIFRRNLYELRQLITHIGDHPQAINDTDFMRRIKEVNESVNDLLEDARRAGGGSGSGGALNEQLEHIRIAIVDLQSQCDKITTEIIEAQSSSRNSIIDVTSAERLINEAEYHLRQAEVHIETDGRDALRQAQEAQTKVGQQSERMTEIAKQAREEVERQEMDAKRIEDTAAKALNTSQEALRIAREALQKPKDLSRDLDDLRRKLTDMEKLYQETKSMADLALKQAQKTYSDSLTIYSESESVIVPKVDSTTLKTEASDVKAEAERIKDEANKLMQQHRSLMDDINRQKQDAERLLERGIEQQQIADELLSDADVARDIARQAVAQAEKILRDAQEALKTLQEFDKKVQESQKKAADALKKVPEIDGRIQEAEEKTRQARDDLADAEENARLAKEIAELAQNVADMASEDAGRLRLEADATKKRATELKVETEILAEEVEDLSAKIEALEKQAKDDEQVIKEALEKAGQAKTDASETSKKVTEAMAVVKEISDILANLDDIDSAKLDQLWNSLVAANETLHAANIEERYNELVAAHLQQKQWVNDYTLELIQLHRDVENVRVINETIPRTCYSNIELEPVAPNTGR